MELISKVWYKFMLIIFNVELFPDESKLSWRMKVKNHKKGDKGNLKYHKKKMKLEVLQEPEED